jgi:malonate-semialdehyde dehydrogenase (acetylating)/methylmalonate-semialdehyde dehydrogenase
VNPKSELSRTEIFGPVLGLMHLETIEDAIALVNSGQWGNMACLFTNSGAAARKFRYEAEAGNIGINLVGGRKVSTATYMVRGNMLSSSLHKQKSLLNAGLKIGRVSFERVL